MDTTTIPVDISALRYALLYALIVTPGVIAALTLAPVSKRLGYSIAWGVFSVLAAALFERGGVL